MRLAEYGGLVALRMAWLSLSQVARASRKTGATWTTPTRTGWQPRCMRSSTTICFISGDMCFVPPMLYMRFRKLAEEDFFSSRNTLLSSTDHWWRIDSSASLSCPSSLSEPAVFSFSFGSHFQHNHLHILLRSSIGVVALKSSGSGLKLSSCWLNMASNRLCWMILCCTWTGKSRNVGQESTKGNLLEDALPLQQKPRVSSNRSASPTKHLVKESWMRRRVGGSCERSDHTRYMLLGSIWFNIASIVRLEMLWRSLRYAQKERKAGIRWREVQVHSDFLMLTWKIGLYRLQQFFAAYHRNCIFFTAY